MTIMEDRPVVEDEDERLDVPEPETEARGVDEQDAAEDDDDRPGVEELWRPVLAAALAAAAAGLVCGGIFGSWGARVTGFVAAFAGAGYVVVALRSVQRNLVVQAFPVVALVAAAFSLVTRGESPGALPTLVGDAIESGRLFAPPVPYDPGWTPILFLLISVLGFSAAWVGTELSRPRLAIAIPLPLTGLAALTQPDDGEFIAGLCAFLPVLAALSVLFRGDTARTAGLGSAFELKRAARSLLLAVPLVAALVALSSTSLLFPEPVYDPTNQPQKPKPIPLSAAADRVLFEIETDDQVTGPWRAGVLDVYEDDAWKLPPFDRSRFEALGAAGLVSTLRADAPRLSVTFTLRDLGDTSVLPITAGANTITGQLSDLVYDPRAGLLRVQEGRAPSDFTYTVELARYPTDEQLRAADRTADPDDFVDQLAAPPVPGVVRDLLSEVGDNPWARLDHLRQTLLDNVTAKGAGTPVDITAERAAELLEPDAKATPFEIVATEALLARWAGIPSRVGFGFDGVNDEDGLLTVRPRNSAQWLEVHWPGFGWVPLIGAPKQAEASLEDNLSRFDPSVVTGSDVAVEVFLPFKHDNAELLFQRIRNEIIFWSPIIALVGLAWIGWPVVARAHRRAKRRRWAEQVGPSAQIAVEYTEFRDLATDLNVGDIYATPLEFLYVVRDDDEHEHFAWLHTRSLYGDLRDASEADARAAEQMGASLRRRLRRAQPAVVQVGSLISRASLQQPYSTELPTVRIPRLPALPAPWRRTRRRGRLLRDGRRRLRSLIPARST